MLNIDGRINTKQMDERMPNKVNGTCRVQVPFLSGKREAILSCVWAATNEGRVQLGMSTV